MPTNSYVIINFSTTEYTTVDEDSNAHPSILFPDLFVVGYAAAPMAFEQTVYVYVRDLRPFYVIQ